MAPKTSRKTPPKRSSNTKKRKPASKRPSRTKKPPPPPPWTTRARGWILRRSVDLAIGATLGAMLAGTMVYFDARNDVRDWMAAPPAAAPMVVFSAPIRLRNGESAATAEIANDLMHAGYERVEHIDGSEQFTELNGHFTVRTSATRAGDSEIPNGTTKFAISNGRISGLSRPATLRPTVLARLGDTDSQRTRVQLEALPAYVEQAVLAMEDTRFHDHMGVDPLGIARAVFVNLTTGRLQGGSTLTQQLAKNLFLNSERTLRRKVLEVFYAASLENELSKDQLVELYLSEVYLGHHRGVPIHGVEQAARAFFGVSAERLTLAQAATIAGVIASPNTYSPLRDEERAIQRRSVVLKRMTDVGFIESHDADAGNAAPLALAGVPPAAAPRAPWVVDVVLDQLDDRLEAGEVGRQGLTIHTTVQPHLQRAAAHAVSSSMTALDNPAPRGAQAALVAVDGNTGAVLAVVGSRDYVSSPFNRATQAWRQMGSTAKPFTLLAAFDEDRSLSPLDRLDDEPITITTDGTAWTPENYDGEFKGRITVRQAMAQSRNVPAVRLAETVGFTDLKRVLQNAGLSRATALPSASLGAFESNPWEVAGAYTTFVSGGRASRPWIVRSIHGPDGTPLFTHELAQHGVASSRAAGLTNSVLESVIDIGTGKSARTLGVAGPVGGKTGTTDEFRDAWFAGFNAEISVAVWVGRDRDTLGLTGASGALPTWAHFMNAVGSDRGRIRRDVKMEPMVVCVESDLPATDACPTTTTAFVEQGAEAVLPCDVHGEPLARRPEQNGWFRRLFRRGGRKARGDESE